MLDDLFGKTFLRFIIGKLKHHKKIQKQKKTNLEKKNKKE